MFYRATSPVHGSRDCLTKVTARFCLACWLVASNSRDLLPKGHASANSHSLRPSSIGREQARFRDEVPYLINLCRSCRCHTKLKITPHDAMLASGPSPVRRHSTRCPLVSKLSAWGIAGPAGWGWLYRDNVTRSSSLGAGADPPRRIRVCRILISVEFPRGLPLFRCPQRMA